jgi:16S rRNA (guanine(966)-N(2))-methyltransferase RsmD
MGLEAISRGAQLAVFTEPDRAALATLHRNVRLLGTKAQVEIWPISAEEFVSRCLAQNRRFDLIFADPPWRVGVSEIVSQRIGAVLDSRGVLVLESRQDTPAMAMAGLSLQWSRRYGDTRLTGYQPILSDSTEVSE